jgi:hypothetical protein
MGRHDRRHGRRRRRGGRCSTPPMAGACAAHPRVSPGLTLRLASLAQGRLPGAAAAVHGPLSTAHGPRTGTPLTVSSLTETGPSSTVDDPRPAGCMSVPAGSSNPARLAGRLALPRRGARCCDLRFGISREAGGRGSSRAAFVRLREDRHTEGQGAGRACPWPAQDLRRPRVSGRAPRGRACPFLLRGAQRPLSRRRGRRNGSRGFDGPSGPETARAALALQGGRHGA